MSMDIQVFAAQINNPSDHVGTTSAPPQSVGSREPQNDDASGVQDSNPSSVVVLTNRSAEQESSDIQTGAGDPPVADTQLPGQPVLSGPNWDSSSIHSFDGTTASHPYQGASEGPGGVTMVMRLNPSPLRSDLQESSDEVGAGGSERIEYSGGKQKFVCETCGQPFSSKYNVKRHQQSTNVHKGDRSGRDEGFFCAQCGRKLSRPDALRRHERKGSCGKRPGGSGQGPSTAPPQ